MAAKPLERCACPKCGRSLEQSGELVVAGVVLATYQCDECLMNVDFGGEVIEVALTFCRRADGTLFDPADPEGQLRF
jgi:hypothetical protein